MDQFTPKRFSLAEIEAAMFEDGGFCIACGELSDSLVEPDARGYRCCACERRAVYGAQEILLMELVD